MPPLRLVWRVPNYIDPDNSALCRSRAPKRWCPGPESNRYVPFGTRDFKSRASASFATRARYAAASFYSYGWTNVFGQFDSQFSQYPVNRLGPYQRVTSTLPCLRRASEVRLMLEGKRGVREGSC
jgi:hypothetical protein